MRCMKEPMEFFNLNFAITFLSQFFFVSSVSCVYFISPNDYFLSAMFSIQPVTIFPVWVFMLHFHFGSLFLLLYQIIISSCSAIKNGSHMVHSIMNLDNTCKKALDGIENKIQCHCNTVEKEIAHWNIRNDLIKKGRGLIDAENNKRHQYCCAQSDKKTCIVRCFEKEDMGKFWNEWPMSALTKFQS